MKDTFRLSPLLLLYLVFVLWHATNAFQGDEGRYVLNAENLLKGYFASSETRMFWNGPGYPLYLLPFVALGLPLILAKLGNAVFLFLCVVYFHRSLLLLNVGKRSLWYSYGLGVFLLLHGSLIELLMTEALAAFLLAGAAYHYCKWVQGEKKWSMDLAATALHLGSLALTKVLFGYVLVGAIALSLFAGMVLSMGLFHRKERARRSALGAGLACLLALGFCLPYLAYTYAQTGKLFFWSNSGGSMLYCMSMPEQEFLGDWINSETMAANPEFFHTHARFYQEINALDYFQQDERLKRAAMENIRKYPIKFFKNWRANINRLVFGFPVTGYPSADSNLSTGNRSFIYALPFFLFFFSLIPAWLGRKIIPPEVHGCLLFALIALGGLSFLGTIPRMVFPLLPILGLWTIGIAEKVYQVSVSAE